MLFYYSKKKARQKDGIFLFCSAFILVQTDKFSAHGRQAIQHQSHRQSFTGATAIRFVIIFIFFGFFPDCVIAA